MVRGSLELLLLPNYLGLDDALCWNMLRWWICYLLLPIKGIIWFITCISFINWKNQSLFSLWPPDFFYFCLELITVSTYYVSQIRCFSDIWGTLHRNCSCRLLLKYLLRSSLKGFAGVGMDGWTNWLVVSRQPFLIFVPCALCIEIVAGGRGSR